MLETDVEKELHERLIEFAKKHPKIKAVFKGTNPDDRGRKYWFILGRENIQYDDKLTDKIINLDLELANGLLLKTEDVELASWPIDIEEASDPDYSFIGECIYKK